MFTHAVAKKMPDMPNRESCGAEEFSAADFFSAAIFKSPVSASASGVLRTRVDCHYVSSASNRGVTIPNLARFASVVAWQGAVSPDSGKRSTKCAGLGRVRTVANQRPTSV